MLNWLVLIATLFIQSQRPERVVLEFRSSRCPACDHLDPVIDSLVQEGWVVRQVDINRERSIAERYRIRQVPTMVVLARGEEVDRIVGYVPLDELRNRLLGIRSQPTPIVRGQSPLAVPPNVEAAESSNRSLGPMVGLNSAERTPDRAVVPADFRLAQSNDPSAAPYMDRPERTSTQSIPNRAPVGNPQDATVRIRVNDHGSEAVGTGTIIDTHGNEALVLTCGHLFRDGQGRSPVTVELFRGNESLRIPAQVVDFRADEVDIGLLSFQVPFPVTPVKLLPQSVRLLEQQPVFSFGCDAGADPSRRDSRITKLNRYLGPSNVEVAVAPTQGRSGGGLFDEENRLIGVCFAADNDYDEGLYSGPDVVYEQLNRLGLKHLYGR